jgi:hypothetical protein
VFGSVGAGSHKRLRLPPLFWVLLNDFVEALLHTACNTFNQLRRGLAPQPMGPSAVIPLGAASIYVMPPTQWFAPRDTEGHELGPDHPLGISVRWQQGRDLEIL